MEYVERPAAAIGREAKANGQSAPGTQRAFGKRAGRHGSYRSWFDAGHVPKQPAQSRSPGDHPPSGAGAPPTRIAFQSLRVQGRIGRASGFLSRHAAAARTPLHSELPVPLLGLGCLHALYGVALPQLTALRQPTVDEEYRTSSLKLLRRTERLVEDGYVSVLPGRLNAVSSAGLELLQLQSNSKELQSGLPTTPLQPPSCKGAGDGVGVPS